MTEKELNKNKSEELSEKTTENNFYRKESNENLLLGLASMEGENLLEIKEEIGKRIGEEWESLLKEKETLSKKINKTEEEKEKLEELNEKIDNIKSEIKNTEITTTGGDVVREKVLSIREDIAKHREKEEKYRASGDFEKMKKMQRWQQEKRSRLNGDNFLKVFDMENSEKRKVALKRVEGQIEEFSNVEESMTTKEIIEKINDMKGERFKEKKERMTMLLGLTGVKELIDLLQRKDELEIEEESSDFSPEKKRGAT